MPELSSDMTEADLLSWLVKPGDRIELGDLIAELETEKSTVEFESPASGTLLEIVVPEGTNGVQVGTVIALLEEAGDAAQAPSSEAPSSDAPSSDAPTGEAPLGEVPAARDPESVPEPPPTPVPSPSTAETAATPVAKRIAEQSGVELERIT
jgi:pyruvate dehydrogenase E2 component (dihydrolipoamide acetyltransferase)